MSRVPAGNEPGAKVQMPSLSASRTEFRLAAEHAFAAHAADVTRCDHEVDARQATAEPCVQDLVLPSGQHCWRRTPPWWLKRRR